MAKGKYDEWLTPDGLLRLEAWARDGLTDEQIARNCGINVSTLYTWKGKYAEIDKALKKGKEVVDIEVENALLKRAKGYIYQEKTWELRKGAELNDAEFGDDGPADTENRLVLTKVVTKEVQPDVAAQFIWLKNRRPDKWRDKPVETAATVELLEKAKEMLDGVQSAF